MSLVWIGAAGPAVAALFIVQRSAVERPASCLIKETGLRPSASERMVCEKREMGVHTKHRVCTSLYNAEVTITNERVLEQMDDRPRRLIRFGGEPVPVGFQMSKRILEIPRESITVALNPDGNQRLRVRSVPASLITRLLVGKWEIRYPFEGIAPLAEFSGRNRLA